MTLILSGSVLRQIDASGPVLTLIIKLPNGEHLRRAILTPSEDSQREFYGERVLRLEEFSLAPADAVTLWLEV